MYLDHSRVELSRCSQRGREPGSLFRGLSGSLHSHGEDRRIPSAGRKAKQSTDRAHHTAATVLCIRYDPVSRPLFLTTIHPTPTRPAKKQNNHDRSINLRIPLLLQQPSAPHAAAAYGAGKRLRNSPPCSLSACSATNLGRHHGPAREPDSALHRQLLRRHARRHVRRVLSLSGLCGDIPAQAVLPAPI